MTCGNCFARKVRALFTMIVHYDKCLSDRALKTSALSVEKAWNDYSQ